MRLTAQILNRYDTAANWNSENPTLASGELGVQSDGYFKIGDGVTDWSSLDYAGGATELTNYFLLDGSRELAGHLLPEMTGASGTVSARDIGSPDQKIRRLYAHDAYIDAGSLYVNNKKVIEDDSGTITVSTDADQDLQIKTTGTGDVVFNSENEVNSVAKGGIEFTVPSDNPTKHLNFTNQSANGNITFSAAGTNAQVQLTATDEVDITAPNVDINGDANVSGEFTFGTLHHHNLTGKDDDDHTQYVLANGTRAFTGKVVGVSPTETNQLATKSYVDSVVQGLDWYESVLDITDIGSAVESTGNRYIATTTSGGWTANYIYEWGGSSWEETVVDEGAAAWVEDVDALYTFNSSNWIRFGSTITHENLNAVNGGTYRHLTADQVTQLTNSGTCTIHTHEGGGLPSGAIILVDSNTAITGFTLLTDVDDGVVYITKGSVAGGEVGGSAKTGGTWTQPNHTHTGPNHRHTGPNHNHQWFNYTNSTTNGKSYNSAGSSIDISRLSYSNGRTTIGSSSQCDGTWGRNGLYPDFYTTKVSGYTGYGGTENTGGGATANTWRPKGNNFTRQQKI